MAALPQINISQWYTWLSNDQFLGPDGSFQYSSNIDVRKNPRGIQLNGVVGDYGSDLSSLHDVSCMLQVDSYALGGYTTMFTKSWSIFINNGWWVEVASGFSAIYNAAVFKIWGNDYVVFFTSPSSWSGQAKKILLSDASSLNTAGSWNAVITNTGSTYDIAYSVTSTASIPLLVYQSTAIIFASGSKIYKLDNTGVSTLLYTFRTFEVCTGITLIADQLRVYTTQWREPGNGTLYMCNVSKVASSSISFDYTIPWDQLPIQSVKNVWNVDYVLAGDSANWLGNLFIAQGYTRDRVFKNKDINNSLFSWNINTLTNYNDVLILAGKNQNWEIGIFSYGKYLPWFTDGLVFDHTVQTSWSQNDIYAICPFRDEIFVAYKNQTTGKTHVSYVKRDNIPVYATSGTIISKINAGWLVWQRKNIKEINVWYDLSSANGHGGSIKLYARVNYAGSLTSGWSQIGTDITDTTVNYRRFLPNEIPFKEWNTIELKLELYSGSSNTKTPVVYDLNVTYDIVNN